MFELYTEKARRVIFFARYETAQLGGKAIECEHMLLGLLREDERMLGAFIDPASFKEIRERVEKGVVRSPRLPASEDIRLTAECQRVLAFAAEEATGLKQSWIGTGHLLLGLLRVEGSPAAKLLVEHGADIATIRRRLGEEGHPDRPSGLPANSYRYLHLDVFTDRLFTGNQLAVFLEPAGLTPELMQRIALEMAFSETTFVFPKETKEVDARVRIFTPRAELPMAGHPTIGTTFALAHQGTIAPHRSEIVLGLGVGPVRVRLEWEQNELRFAWMVQPLPVFGATADDVSGLAAALGVSEGDIRDTGLPVQEVSCGMPYLFVPLASRRAVDAAVVDQQGLSRFYSSANLPEHGTFIFSMEKAADGATAYSRMFAPAFGVPEDPATGGASGPLGAYLVSHGAVQEESMVSLQGVKMGRPSRIHISVKKQDGVIREVQVGGRAVVVGDGTIRTE